MWEFGLKHGCFLAPQFLTVAKPKNVASVKYVGVILEEIRHSHGELFRRARLVGLS